MRVLVNARHDFTIELEIEDDGKEARVIDVYSHSYPDLMDVRDGDGNELDYDEELADQDLADLAMRFASKVEPHLVASTNTITLED